jgi:hypothetical protein
LQTAAAEVATWRNRFRAVHAIGRARSAYATLHLLADFLP